MSERQEGSCLCGGVRFEITGNFEKFYLCHCEYCRKDTGSAHAANLFSTSARLEWLAGENQISSFTLPATRHTKSFCAVCGSALPNLQMGGKLCVVPAGSLDTAVSIRPEAHLFVASQADWDVDLEQIPKLDGLPF